KSLTEHAGLDAEILRWHCVAPCPATICGLHVMDPDERCRITVVDIDRHAEDDADRRLNWRLALHVYRRARAVGLDALLLDSNGRGGYHIWVVHQGLIPGADAYRLGKWLVRDHGDFGQPRPPETFPKSPHHN